MPFETAVKHIRCNLMAWNYDFGYKECPAGGKVKRIIGIHRQLTGSKDCIRGETYGSIQDKVWVRGGCAAVIIVLLDGRCICSRVIFKKNKIITNINFTTKIVLFPIFSTQCFYVHFF